MAFTLRRSVCWAALAASLVACGSAPRPAPVYSYALTPGEEAATIARAKQSPIAQPRERPRYPDKAPPPTAAGEPPVSPFAARFADVSRAARTEPDSTDFELRQSYAAPVYGWRGGIGLWPGYDGWRECGYGCSVYWDPWPYGYMGDYHTDYRLRSPSLSGGWHHNGHVNLGTGHGHSNFHAHH
jgi:hypothetical protein